MGGYLFLNDVNLGYQHLSHNHGGGDFGYGNQSKSHIESILGILKAKIKSVYNIIPSKNLLHFVRETEFKYKNRLKTNDEKLIEFLERWKPLHILSDEEYVHNDFLSDEGDE